ncbi:protein TIC110, chloroplastic-like [Zingiber officinale]|uniref:protein TIC110, chloroplastic-like n=1 Tax=Zingiber officinale TaxID=94328 RepID=UPI001C4C5CE3|nr:protein TIC110, chloroplastic-like [Zingiber officinale]
METSLLIATPPVPSRRLLLSRLAFASPRRFLPRLPSCRLLRCRRCRLSLPRCYVSQAPAVATSVDPSVFGGPKELSGPQAVISSLPPPARLASSIVLTAIAIAAGFGIGVRLGGTKAAGIGVAAALGAASGAAAYSLNSKVPEVAAVSLHNLVVGYDDPADLSKDEVEAIVQKYGVSKQDDAFKAELRDLYSRFVSSILPPGSENLKGNEAETIIKFKDALGIDDPDAALVHVEIGRHIYRQRLETGDREADIEQRKAFQKLIYVSTLVFGEASKFLLPWKRLFNVTDSQIEIAIRDNAQKLYASKLKAIGQDIDEKQLIDLRQSQLLYKLSDQTAGEMFREHTRKLVEENISSALLILKSRTHATMGIAHVVQELDKVLEFNNTLISLSKHHENGQFAPGVGPISLLGGEYDGDRKFDDLKILYRSYAEESFPDGRLQEEKLAALNQLRNIFGLGKREAENIMLDVTSRVYRRRLARAFSGGDLDAAPSKAAYLQNLCEDLHFDPNNASKIHEEIYRQKLQQFVEDGELSDEEVASLQRYRVLLCIHQETVDATHADICGRLFEKAVRDAIASGVDGYDDDMRNSVRKASQGLRLTTEAAMAIASKAVRKVFLTYIQRSKSAGSRTEAAKELKKLIAFNALVVTDLVSDIKGEHVAPTEPIDVEAKPVDEEDEWESLQTLRKTRPSKELDAKSSKPVQTEITLGDDLPERDRAEIYRTYLLFCITGETTAVPFGAQIVTKKDNSEFQLLKQLGGILGMSDKEIVEVHRNFAEQAFMKQAEIILADGQLTKARIEQLNEVQKQVGLPAEYAQKVIKNITTTKMSRAIETAVAQGRIGIKQVRELKEANIDLDNMISERLRENLFKKTVEEIFSSGTGVFEEVEVYERIPSDLSIDAEKAKAIVKEHAKSRLANTLVQAVAQLRQKNRDGVVSSLNDMLACDTAVPADPLTWSSPKELADLYCAYLKSIPKPEKLSRLQYLLGISDATATILRDTAERGALPEEDEDEEKFEF